MKDMTLINVILDRSGSMNGIKEEVIGMFNDFLDDQKKQDDYAELTLVQFDNKYETIYESKKLKKCKHLTEDTFIPRGMTALHDAVGMTISKIDENFKNNEDERPERVLFVIITDGYENCSHEYNGSMIKKMISEKEEKYKWDFIFLGAGIDAALEGDKFGMSMQKCASFDLTPKGFNDTTASINDYTANYRSTGNISNKL